MDVRQLKYFVRIVEMESISAAAKALFVAQPSLSQHVANLERELGTQLLIRGAHGVSPTPQGEKLYHSARSILRQVDDTLIAIQSERLTPAGKVSVGLPISTTRMVGCELVRRIGEKYPDIVLNVIEGVTSDLTALTDRQRLDVAVLADVRDGSSLVTEELVEEQLLFVSRRQQQATTLAACAAHPLVLPSYPNSVRVRLESACLERGLAVRVVAESASASLMLEMVHAGIAATLLPWAALAGEPGQGTQMFASPISDMALSRRLFICISRSAQSSSASVAVHAVLRAIMQEKVSSGRWREARLLADGPPQSLS